LWCMKKLEMAIKENFPGFRVVGSEVRKRR
jgi:hypothetical protein